ELGDDRRLEALALLAREASAVEEDLDVRAQRGDRRAQLMRGVGDEVPLGLDRALQRLQRPVEAVSEAGELGRAALLEPLRAVERVGDTLGAAREAADRRQRRAADHAAEPGGDEDAGDDRDQEDDEELVELVVDGGEGQQDLDGMVVDGVGHRVDPQVGPLHRDVVVVAPPPALRERHGALGDGDEQGPAARREGAAVGIDELHLARRAAERVLAGLPVPIVRGTHGAAGPALPPAGMRPQILLRGRGELRVDLPAQVRAHAVVLDDREHRDDEGHAERDRRRDPPLQAHGSLSTYPTPWIVWITRGDPPASSLRRRYPTYTRSALPSGPKS